LILFVTIISKRYRSEALNIGRRLFTLDWVFEVPWERSIEVTT